MYELTPWSRHSKQSGPPNTLKKHKGEQRHESGAAWQGPGHLRVFLVGVGTVQSLLEGSLAVGINITKTQILWPKQLCLQKFILRIYVYMCEIIIYTRYSLGLPCGLRGKESACHAGDTGASLGSGWSPGEGDGNLLQYSCLNAVDRGARQAAVHGGHKRVGHNSASQQQHSLLLLFCNTKILVKNLNIH